MRVLVRPSAAADMDEAYLWYEGRSDSLGNEFLAAAQSAIDAIAGDPLKHPVVHRSARRMLLKRFPYAIYYRVYDNLIVVVACMPGRRNPSQWRSRT